MSGEEKSRISGEAPRQGSSPVLPTVNPQAPQSASSGLSIHPSLYVV